MDPKASISSSSDVSKAEVFSTENLSEVLIDMNPPLHECEINIQENYAPVGVLEDNKCGESNYKSGSPNSRCERFDLISHSPKFYERMSIEKNNIASPNLVKNLKVFHSSDSLDIPFYSGINQSEILDQHLKTDNTSCINIMGHRKLKSQSNTNHLIRDEFSNKSTLSYNNNSLERLVDCSNTVETYTPSSTFKIKKSDCLDNNKSDINYNTNQNFHLFSFPQSELNPLSNDTVDAKNYKAALSKSQPDLSKTELQKKLGKIRPEISRSLLVGEREGRYTSFGELIDMLTHENKVLKLELDIYHQKVEKLIRFELEIIKVEEQYESLVKLCERREQLERLARQKLQNEIHKLYEQNRELKDQIGNQNLKVSPSETNADRISLQKELNKRDIFIAQLVSKNKELTACKERQEMELTAQRQTLNEQRTHIDILDSALTTAQTNIVKLEEEVCRKRNLEEQLEQLKRLLISKNIAAERREQSEKSLRQKLEMEILQLRSSSKMDHSLSKPSELRREIRDKDEKIMYLEGEIAKLEQKLQGSPVQLLCADQPYLLKRERSISSHEPGLQDTHSNPHHVTNAKCFNLSSQKDEDSDAINMNCDILLQTPNSTIQGDLPKPPPLVCAEASQGVSNRVLENHSKMSSYCYFAKNCAQISGETISHEKRNLDRSYVNQDGININSEKRLTDTCNQNSKSSGIYSMETLSHDSLHSDEGQFVSGGTQNSFLKGVQQGIDHDLESEESKANPVISSCSPSKSQNYPPSVPCKLSTSQNLSAALGNSLVVCQLPHSPSVFCRTCLSVRQSHRRNAAALVRRANSNGCNHNRRSAPVIYDSRDPVDDSPSILERLKSEWEMGFLDSKHSKEEVLSSPYRMRKLKMDETNVSEKSKPQFDSFRECKIPEENSSNNAHDSSRQFKEKKGVSHLDRALNRLSIKRNSHKLIQPNSGSAKPSMQSSQDSREESITLQNFVQEPSTSCYQNNVSILRDKSQINSEGPPRDI